MQSSKKKILIRELSSLKCDQNQTQYRRLATMLLQDFPMNFKTTGLNIT